MMRKIFTLIFGFILAITANAQNPSDGCTGVPVLTVGAVCTPMAYTLPGSYANGGLVIASCATNNNRDDGWYQFVATSTTTEIDLTGNRRHCLSVWTACAGGTELACDQQNGGTTASVSVATTIGVTYYVQIQRRQSNNNASMNGNICVHEPTPINNDCSIGIQVCASTGFPGNASGFGTQELDATNRGCLNSNENQSSWYLISIGTSGTFQFTISPQNGTDDYDFAVWGPASACPPTGAPVSCSYAAGGGNTGVNTGLNGGSPETSEGAGGDKYVDDMNVVADEVYILLVDNYTSSSQPFDLTFGGSAGISCIPLPVELTGFHGEINKDVNILSWTTKSELNNAYFTIERSVDGENWEVIGYEPGANNSSQEIEYAYRVYDYDNVLTYYRLSQTDYDGTTKEVGLIALNNADASKKLLRIVNLMGEDVGPDYEGIKIYIYSDGSVVKRVDQ